MHTVPLRPGIHLAARGQHIYNQSLYECIYFSTDVLFDCILCNHIDPLYFIFLHFSPSTCSIQTLPVNKDSPERLKNILSLSFLSISASFINFFSTSTGPEKAGSGIVTILSAEDRSQIWPRSFSPCFNTVLRAIQRCIP